MSGEREGPWDEWYDNGQMRRHETYRGGLLHGAVSSWSRDGEPLPTQSFADGSGAYTSWHANGRPESRGELCRGAQCGLWRDWYANGQLARETEYLDATPIRAAEWYEDGQEASRGQYQRGKSHGEWTFWHQDGELYRVCTFDTVESLEKIR